MVLGKSYCPEDDIDKTKFFFDALEAVNEFTYEQYDGYSKSGSAHSIYLKPFLIALEWQPVKAEGGVFLFSYDVKKNEYYTFHAYAFQTKTKFYPGSFDLSECKINFEISERERIELILLGKNSFNIHIEAFDEKSEAYSTVSDFRFRKSAN